MSKTCVQCSAKDRINHHQLDPLLANTIYESADMIVSLSLPRKYTSTHNDEPPAINTGIGHNYIDRLLNTTEVIENQTEVLGKWIQNNGKYEIHLKLAVSTEENPDVVIRNNIFCSELDTALEAIALAETPLLTLHPELASTKIFIHFQSIDHKYNRVEYWHRLGHWAPKFLCDQSNEQIHNNPNKRKDDKLEKHKKTHYERRPPQMCQSCQK